VEGANLPASFRALLYVPLQQGGKTLAGAPRPKLPAVVLGSAAATGGSARAAARVAAALELFLAGLDVLDEVEDGDYSPLTERAGQARALNASTALLLLAQRVLSQLVDDGVSAERVPLFLRILTDAGLAATGGQHLDLSGEGQADLSTDDALAIARGKSGALIAGACRLGALLGTGDEELLALYEAWGRHYGTAAQLANDLHDAENASRKSDWDRAKGTLPLIYSRGSRAIAGVAGEQAARESLQVSGALHFTWVVLEVERGACARILDRLAARGQSVEHLRALLD
jgi:geranylgeranyl pyrophosphate synthase